jgi:hypothetical protein
VSGEAFSILRHPQIPVSAQLPNTPNYPICKTAMLSFMDGFFQILSPPICETTMPSFFEESIYALNGITIEMFLPWSASEGRRATGSLRGSHRNVKE